MQSVPIITKVVSSNPSHGVVYSIKHYVIKFVSDLRQVGCIFLVFRFTPTIKLTPRYNRKIVQSGVKHHNPNSYISLPPSHYILGYQQYGNEIQAFQKLPLDIKLISKIFTTDQISMQMVHITLKCRNKAGLQSTLSSNGVKISNLPPQTISAEVEILPHSMTEYNCRNHYQGDITKLRVKWTGFTDMAGLDSYMVRMRKYKDFVYFHCQQCLA
jgi:hypothetical protein